MANHFVVDEHVRSGVAAFLLATLCWFTPAVLLIRQWVLPARAVMVVLTMQALLMQAIVGFRDAGLMELGFVGALAVGVLMRVLRPGPSSRGRVLQFATLAPPLYWSVYVVGIAASDGGLGWKAELYCGVIVWSGILTLGLAALLQSAEGRSLSGA